MAPSAGRLQQIGRFDTQRDGQGLDVVECEIDEPCLDLADMWLVLPRPRFAVGGPDWPVTKQTVN